MKRGAAPRKFTTRHQNYVSSNVKQLTSNDAVDGKYFENAHDSGHELSKSENDKFNLAPSSGGTQSKAFKYQSSKFEALGKRNSQSNAPVGAEAFQLGPSQSDAPTSQTPVAKSDLKPGQLMRFRQRLDEKKRMSSASALGLQSNPGTRPLLEESKERMADPQDEPQRTEEDVRNYVFEDDQGNQQIEQFGGSQAQGSYQPA